MKNPKMPVWVTLLVFGAGIPATYFYIYHSNIGINLAHGQQEVLEERTLGATVAVWVVVFMGLGITRIVLEGQRPTKQKSNQPDMKTE